jgi:hypothetical protein
MIRFAGGDRDRAGDAGHEVEDLVTPLIRGGTDHPSNLQPLCAECNLRKSDQ